MYSKRKNDHRSYLKSTVLTDVTRGKYAEISVDPDKIYESLALDFTNLGLGFVKDMKTGEKASCSWKADKAYRLRL